MRKIATLVVGLTALLPLSGASASELKSASKALVELFTSQGCSSCPPADALLDELNADGGVVALAYHVDYWDYIGWADTFGSPAFSKLQRAYAQARGAGSVYTPQLMVNGVTDAVGSRRNEVNAALAQASLPLSVNLSEENGLLSVFVDGDGRLPESAVWLVTFRQNETVEIGRGENANRTIAYSQIVTGRQVLGMWDPQGGTNLKLPISELLGSSSDGAALIVQEDHNGLPGRVLGAAAYFR